MQAPGAAPNTDTSASGMFDPLTAPRPRPSSVDAAAPPKHRSGPLERINPPLLGRPARAMHDCLPRPTLEDPVGLSILVPVYNEQSTIRSVLERVRAVPFPARTEIVVVNDGSTDRTGEILQSLPDWTDIQVFVHDVNQGKGAAVRTALRHARGRIIVVQDADEELDPSDLLPMYALISSGAASVCYGSRFARGAGPLKWRPIYWANRMLNGLCNLLNGLKLTDMNTCYKMMPAEVAGRLNLESRGFAMEPEITTKLARMGIAISELPVGYRPRSAIEGKKIRAVDFFRYLRAMICFRFSRRNAPKSRTAAVETGVRPNW